MLCAMDVCNDLAQPLSRIFYFQSCEQQLKRAQVRLHADVERLGLTGDNNRWEHDYEKLFDALTYLTSALCQKQAGRPALVLAYNLCANLCGRRNAS